MENSSPYRDGLPTTSSSASLKSERRSKSKSLQTSKPSLIMAFFSCVAWLYVAGRLWQDAENRMLLANLLKKNWGQRPKVLTVEDKLMVLGCKDLERRIVEAEMELTTAKSQGYLKNQLHQSGSSSGRKLLAVIGVYTGFGSRLKRNVFRGSWMPKGDALTKLEERGVVIRFVIGRSANRGDSLDRNIDEENHMTKDFLILDGHEEAQEEFPKKAKFFFSTAVQNWDAEFYVKVDDSIDLDLDGLIELLQSRRGQDSAYIGCMKSGVVIAEDFAATLCTSQPALVLPWKPVMLPQDFMEFMNDLTFQAKNKIIPMSRIDDAVKRILRVKFMMGLFEKPLADLSLVNQLGSQEHRELAREAVRKSLVLLKNGKTIANPLLPLPLFWLCSI